jgi:hypothetical protein
VRSSEDEAQHPVQTRAALWREFKRDTQTAWLEAAMGKVYVKNAEKRCEELSLATSFSTGNWLLDN